MILKKEIKYLVSLKQKKFRTLNQEVIIEGSKLILDAIKYKQIIKKIIYCSKDEIFSEIRSKAKKNNILSGQKESNLPAPIKSVIIPIAKDAITVPRRLPTPPSTTTIKPPTI